MRLAGENHFNSSVVLRMIRYRFNFTNKMLPSSIQIIAFGFRIFCLQLIDYSFEALFYGFHFKSITFELGRIRRFLFDKISKCPKLKISSGLWQHFWCWWDIFHIFGTSLKEKLSPIFTVGFCGAL